ncbi:MAG: hypothetical protein HYV09_28590 [Deltaproteobacteria bacterium]|nr:hypothetical protein [Deltaproteobacteria bacterium]
MDSKSTLFVFALGALAIAGCERKSERTTDISTAPAEPRRDLPPKSDEPVGGGPIAIDQAINKIVGARCDREMKCGNIGPDKKFSDQNSCMVTVGKDFGDDINADECPAGVDTKELDECLTEARNEDCKNPFDTIGRVAACRTSDICRHVK